MKVNSKVVAYLIFLAITTGMICGTNYLLNSKLSPLQFTAFIVLNFIAQTYIWFWR